MSNSAASSSAAPAVTSAVAVPSDQPQLSTAASSEKTAMDTDSHSHSHSISASDESNIMLTQFLNRTDTQEQFAAAVTKYKAISDEWFQADALLKKFIATCSKNSPAISLPNSLKWNLVRQAKLKAVADKDEFYAEEIAELKKIEKESSELAYNVLRQAKEKHLAHLKQRMSVTAFVALSAQEFRRFVAAFAVQFDNIYGSAPSAAAAASSLSASDNQSRFPTALAIAAFEKSVLAQITSSIMDRSGNAIAESNRKSLDSADNHKAQETVTKGAHTGETIDKLIDRKVQPILKSVKHLQQHHSSKAAHSAAASSASSNPARTGDKKRPRENSPRDVDAFADTSRPGTSVHRGGKRVHLPPAAHNHNPSHSSSHAARPQQRPKNGEGGGRHSGQIVKFVPRGGSQRGRGRGGRQ